jgi:hypothetical protein
MAYANDEQRKAAHARRKQPKAPRHIGKLPEHRETPQDKLKRIDPRGLLHEEVARDLALDSHVDLGGWLVTSGRDDFQGFVDALGIAMETGYYAPQDEQEMRRIVHDVAAWADVPERELPEHVIRGWTKRLEVNHETLERAITRASRNYEWITPTNSQGIAQQVLAELHVPNPDAPRVQQIKAYLEKYHVVPAKERLAHERRYGNSWEDF